MVCALEADFFTKFLNTSAKKKYLKKSLARSYSFIVFISAWQNELQSESCKAFVFPTCGGGSEGGGAWQRSALENKKRNVIKGFVCALCARFHVTYTFGHVSKPASF